MKRNPRPALSMVALGLLLGIAVSTSTADAGQVALLSAVEETDGRTGACYSFYPDPATGEGRPYMGLAHDAGSRWDRFDFVWPNLEQPDGNWRAEGLEAYDELVDDLHTSGFNIVGILLWTPDWAASSGSGAQAVPQSGDRPLGWYSPEIKGNDGRRLRPTFSAAASSPPRGLYESWDDWTEADGDPINYWGRFVYKIVSRYGDRVGYWEMWNEPEWSFFWTGTSLEYAQLLKVGYQATKAACPDCQVLFGGLHYWQNPDYYKWVLNTLRDEPQAADSNYFFDIMSVHLYSRSANTYDVVNDIRSGIRARMPDHPIWLTETGVPIWNDARVDPVIEKYDYASTQDEAAAYVIQSYANAWASGVKRYFFFRTHDADMREYFGLIRNDRSLRPAYAALQVASRYLISPTLVTREEKPMGAQVVTLWGTPRGKVTVLWNRTPTPVSFDYDAILQTATLVDQRGATQSIEATHGAYQVSLPGATANLVTNPSDYFIGGEPYLIIEEDTVPPSIVTVDPLPTTTYSHTIPISWRASDDRAGIWGAEIEVREGESVDWLGWLERDDTEGNWSAKYSAGQHNTRYCFRARAWDRAGNVGPWSDETRCTRLDLERTVYLNFGAVFGDGDGNGDWDSDEIALEAVSFRLVDGFGHEVASPGMGASWELTTTLRAGEYAVVIEPEAWPSPPPGWMPRRLEIDLPPGETIWELKLPSVGLLRHRSSSYFPLVARDG